MTLNFTSPIFAQVVDYTAIPSGSTTCPCSTGEGLMPFSRAFLYGDQATLTVSFASAVSGFGMFLGDKFDPTGTDPVVMQAFSGPNGTGSSLGTFQLPSFDYQLGFQVFMGVASTLNEIGSVVFTDGFSASGDGVFVDNLRIASIQGVPEPATLALLGVGLAGLAIMRRKRV